VALPTTVPRAASRSAGRRARASQPGSVPSPPPQHRLCLCPDPRMGTDRLRLLGAPTHLVSRLSHFSMCAGRHSSKCLQQFGRLVPLPTPTPDSRASGIAPLPHSRTSGAVSNSPSHSGFRRASHAFLSIPDFGFHEGKGTAGSCDRRDEPQLAPKSCFVASGARIAGSLTLDAASLKKIPGRSLRRSPAEVDDKVFSG
jgi:hypothetical protein